MKTMNDNKDEEMTFERSEREKVINIVMIRRLGGYEDSTGYEWHWLTTFKCRAKISKIYCRVNYSA